MESDFPGSLGPKQNSKELNRVGTLTKIFHLVHRWVRGFMNCAKRKSI